MLGKIVSGGQTGVDRAALDVALAYGLPHGGWCPRGRRAEDGRIDAKYCLRETPSSDYAARTFRNVADSDGTLILYRAALTGGTRLTAHYASRLGRPCLRVRIEGRGTDVRPVLHWLRGLPISTLNVAGPRESTVPGIYALAAEFLGRLLAAAREDQSP